MINKNTNEPNQINMNIEQLFLAWVGKYNGAYTYCNEICGWMACNEKMGGAKSIRDLKKAIKQDHNFEDRHIRKVDSAFNHFQERLGKIHHRKPTI